jgi:hypothetical protein
LKAKLGLQSIELDSGDGSNGKDLVNDVSFAITDGDEKVLELELGESLVQETSSPSKAKTQQGEGLRG